MRVAVIGQDERAEARLAWCRQAGYAAFAVAPPDAVSLPEADVYDLGGAPDPLPALLGAVLRRPRAVLLMGGAAVTTVPAAERLGRALGRRRRQIALVGGWRFVPAFARLRELVAGGILGAVRAVRVDVRATSAAFADVLPGALDLGWWLAADAPAVLQASGPGALRLQAGPAVIDVAVASTVSGGAWPEWSVVLAGDLGQASATAGFALGYPGRPCGAQSVHVTLAGRPREVRVPAADPAGGELSALLGRLAAGLPWLAVCGSDRLRGLLGLLGQAGGKVGGERHDPG